MKIKNWILILLFIINSSCEKWNYEKRDDHDFITFELMIDNNSDDEGLGIIETNDGGFAIIGSTINSVNGSRDLLLLKIDDKGNESWIISNNTWMITTGIDQNEKGITIEQTADGGFILAGNRESQSNSLQMYLVKTDNIGSLEWEKEFGLDNNDEVCLSFSQHINGYFIIGYQEHPVTKIKNAVIYETNINGTDNPTRHIISINSGTDDFACNIKKTANSSFYVLLNVLNSNSKYDSYIVECANDLGQVLSDTILVGTDCINNNCSFLQTSDERIAIVNTIINSGKYEARLVITNSACLNPSVKTYDDSNAEFGTSIYQTSDDGFIILTSGLVLIKTDFSGTEQWRKDFDGISYGNNAVLQTVDGGYIFTGQKLNPNTNNWDVYIVKTDMNGVVR